MSNTKYRVIFKGDIADGKNLDNVKKRLASVLKADITTIEKLFSGKLIVIKKDADRETCERLKNAFKRAGAICYLQRQESPEIVKTSNTVRKQPAQDEKICPSCGEIIKKKAVICPRCGVRQQAELSKAALLLFTFFLGGIGGHKFYIGKYWQGVLYFVFFWTGIPSLIALVEFIVYACTSTEKLQEKYKPGGSTAIILIIVFVGFMFFIAVIGIIAAIAIPQFVTYRNRAYQHAVISELNNFRVAQEAYFGEYNRYARNLNNLQFIRGNPEVTIEIISADQECFEAKGTHKKTDQPVLIDCNSIRNKGR